MDILILVVIYTVELLKYWVLINGFLDVKLARKWLGAAGLAIYFLLSMNENTREHDSHFTMYLIVMLVTLLSMEVKVIQRVIYLLIALLVTACADEIFGIPLEYIWKSYQGGEIINNLHFLSVSVTSLFFIVAIVFIRYKVKMLKKKNYLAIAKASMPILMLILAFLLAFTVGALNFEKSIFQDKKFELIINIISVLSFISICFLVGFMLYTSNTNKKIQEMLNTERKLKEMQLNYYKEMLAREESTRKYRHDMNNHLICLNQLAKKGRFEELIDYLNIMQEQMIEIQKKVYRVGNEIFDAILNYHLSMLEEGVKVEIIGSLKEEIHISNVDLCTILANLIQNAVEELKRKSSSEKYLKVAIKSGNDFIQIEILNSLSIQSIEKIDLLKSEKTDKRNHGLGIGNVKQTIERNGGKFETRISDNVFVASVVLKKHRENQPFADLTDRSRMFG